MKNRLNVIMFLCSLLSTPVLAQSQDTVGHQTYQKTSSSKLLPQVEISTQRIPSQTNTSAPTQVVTLEKIEQTLATQVSDALETMAGVTIKDYGGVGGVKTVSARGLGSQFSTLAIDGVAVSDCQNGQIDLSRYLIGNAAYVGLYQGQSGGIFQTARGFAAGSVVNIESRRPFTDMLRLSFEGGSFGYTAPTLQFDRRLGRSLVLSFWGNYTYSRGDYPFTMYYTLGGLDSSSVERRRNSETEMATISTNLYWTISPNSYLNAKLHYNQSHHNLPGPATYYFIKASEHTDDDALFAQVRYHFDSHDDKVSLQVVGKAFRSDCVYEDTAANGSSSFLHNEYHQQEYYLSGTLLYHLTPHLSASLASDEALNCLQTNLSHDNNVRRLSSLDVLALSYECHRLTATANLLATLMADDNATRNSYQKLSPYFGLSFLAVDRHDSLAVRHRLRLRYFFKENYRVPTFNELYYFTIAKDLRPEKALQNNLGLTYMGRFGASSLTLTLDAYYNRVTDKLVAIPTQNLFLWSMVNLGRVDIKGLDLNADFNHSLPWHDQQLNFNLNYTFQDARDLTDPADKTYNQQIPYTPRHSGGLRLYWQNPWVNACYSVMLVGDRYRLGQNTPDNLVPRYVDQGLTFNRSFVLSQHSRNLGSLDLSFQVNNIFDVQYEVVKSYPMMGRNFRIKISYKI